MSRPPCKSDVDHIKFTLFKVVQLQEVREKLAVGTDLRAESQLSKLVLTLDQNLVLFGDQC